MKLTLIRMALKCIYSQMGGKVQWYFRAGPHHVLLRLSQFVSCEAFMCFRFVVNML